MTFVFQSLFNTAEKVPLVNVLFRGSRNIPISFPDMDIGGTLMPLAEFSGWYFGSVSHVLNDIME